jgi:hypothetical protein
MLMTGTLKANMRSRHSSAWMKEFNDKFDEVIMPFLEGVPEEIEAVQNIRAAVITRGIADKQYF